MFVLPQRRVGGGDFLLLAVAGSLVECPSPQDVSWPVVVCLVALPLESMLVPCVACSGVGLWLAVTGCLSQPISDFCLTRG